MTRRQAGMSLRAAVSIAACAAALAPATAAVRFAFKVPSLSGGTLSSEDFKGKIVIVDVWATWCGPCRMVIPHLVKLHDRLKDKGVTVVGLNSDEDAANGPGLEAVRRFAHERGINYPIGLMNAETYVELARVMGFNAEEGFSIPTTIVLGRNGLVVKRYPGYFFGQEQEIERLVLEIIESETGPPKKP